MKIWYSDDGSNRDVNYGFVIIVLKVFILFILVMFLVGFNVLRGLLRYVFRFGFGKYFYLFLIWLMSVVMMKGI